MRWDIIEAKQIINLLLLSDFYSDCIRLGHSLWSANQLLAEEVNCRQLEPFSPLLRKATKRSQGYIHEVMATANDASRCSAYLQIKRSACYFRRQNTSFLPATFLTRMNYVYCASFTNRGSAYYFTEKFRRTSNNHWLCFFVFFFFEEMTHVSRTMRLNGDKKRHNEGVVETNCKWIVNACNK